MKRTLIFLAILATTYAGSASAQTTPAPGSVISAPRSPVTPGQSSSGFLTFTNPAGGTFSVDQLDSQLRNLQLAVNQALPMLSAFNNQFTSNTGNQSLGGVLSRVFNRNGSTAQNPGTSGSGATNWLSALSGLFQNNANNPAGVDRTTLNELANLQKQLQPVAQTLQGLNPGAASASAAPGAFSSTAPYNTNQFTGSTNFNNPPLTPTGR